MILIQLHHQCTISLIADCVRGIREEGMPIHRHPDVRGNLYITFEIEFPESGSLNEQSIVVGIS